MPWSPAPAPRLGHAWRGGRSAGGRKWALRLCRGPGFESRQRLAGCPIGRPECLELEADREGRSCRARVVSDLVSDGLTCFLRSVKRLRMLRRQLEKITCVHDFIVEAPQGTHEAAGESGAAIGRRAGGDSSPRGCFVTDHNGLFARKVWGWQSPETGREGKASEPWRRGVGRGAWSRRGRPPAPRGEARASSTRSCYRHAIRSSATRWVPVLCRTWDPSPESRAERGSAVDFAPWTWSIVDCADGHSKVQAGGRAAPFDSQARGPHLCSAHRGPGSVGEIFFSRIDAARLCT